MKTESPLKHWLDLFLRIEDVYDTLRRTFDASPDCEMMKALYESHAEYTNLLAEKVGDKDGWLEWFLWENSCGKKGLSAKAASWKKERPIKTLKDLQALIRDSK